MALIFVTSNRHKFEEVSEFAVRHGVELEHCDTPYIEIQADELEQVVRPSVQQACALLRQPCFAEDAGLFVQTLRGFPGPYSNFVFRTMGNEGLLKLMNGEKDRRAEFKSAVGYCEPGKKPQVFTGKVEGTISLEARGTRGFGFDPVFVASEGDGRTFAEMSMDEKNRFSHRARAIEAFFKWYKQREKVRG
ncbi:dITP/XTP pyrophosphatase [subsurface metagenome]